MKKLLFGVLFLAGVSYAAPRVEEMPITKVGTATTVSISTSAWTAVPTATSLTSRNGLLVSVPATSNANVVGVLINCGETAPATTVRPIEIVKGNGFTLFPLDQGVCLELLSLHTAAENVHVIEIKQ
jgi:hypothetical protein